jgi:hypothetical protein
MTQTALDWRDQLGGKLVSPEEAVAVIKYGDSVWAGGWTSVPPQLCGALAARGPELKDVTIVSFLTPYKWDTPENLANFKIITGFASPLDRAAAREGRMEYVTVGQFREGIMPPGLDHYDVAASLHHVDPSGELLEPRRLLDAYEGTAPARLTRDEHRWLPGALALIPLHWAATAGLVGDSIEEAERAMTAAEAWWSRRAELSSSSGMDRTC